MLLSLTSPFGVREKGPYPKRGGVWSMKKHKIINNLNLLINKICLETIRIITNCIISKERVRDLVFVLLVFLKLNIFTSSLIRLIAPSRSVAQ